MITYEALGLCGEGGAGELIDSGAVTYGGDWVVNPSGGLISKGHPLGATGLAQCAELTWQLRELPTPVRSTARSSRSSTTSASAAPASSPCTRRPSSPDPPFARSPARSARQGVQFACENCTLGRAEPWRSGYFVVAMPPSTGMMAPVT